MSSTLQLLKDHTVQDLFTIVYTVVDDYLKQSLEANRFSLPKSDSQKASYAEILTIAFVGEILNQPKSGIWFLIAKHQFRHLFKKLPDVTRYYRILKNLERIMADFALCLANTVDDETTYSTDSKPIPVCHMKRNKFPRAMTEASKGYGTMGGVFGFKLHAVVNNVLMLCRFAIVPANEADITVARALLNPECDEFDRILADKATMPVRCILWSRGLCGNGCVYTSESERKASNSVDEVDGFSTEVSGDCFFVFNSRKTFSLRTIKLVLVDTSECLSEDCGS